MAVQPADATPAVPAGTPTVWSAVVSNPPNPAQPNVAIPVTATITNQDGSIAATETDTVTIDATPGATAFGDLFGAIVIPAAGTKKK